MSCGNGYGGELAQNSCDLRFSYLICPHLRSLVTFDRMMSCSTGRSAVTREEELVFFFGFTAGRASDMSGRFDVEFPAECDDEYWEHPDPALRFKQPPGKPSTIAFSIAIHRLMGLYGIILRVVVRLRCFPMIRMLIASQFSILFTFKISCRRYKKD